MAAVRIVAIVLLLSPAAALAQTQPGGLPTPSTPAAEPAWSFHFSAAAYLFGDDDDDDYVQPTVTADRGRLHLESRYNYEDRNSVSGFVGWNIEVGDRVTLELTPMVGGLVGDTDAVVPAVELTLGFGRFELYTEGEYVIDLNRSRSRFLYNWSEFTFWPTEWLRAGIATQRTRTFNRRPRDIQRGIVAGVASGRLEGAFYVFNPGSDDRYFVISIGVAF